MTTGDTEIVLALRAAIEQRIGRKRFDLWFGSNTLLHPRQGSLSVVAPSQFFLDWLRRNFRPDIEAASQQVLGETLPIVFELGSLPAGAAALLPASNHNHQAFDAPPATGRVAPSEFVRAQASPPQSVSSPSSAAPQDPPGFPALRLPTATLTPGPSSQTSPSTAEGSRRVSSVASPGTEGALAAQADWKPRLENFVVGDGNRMAFTSAEMVVASPGRYNPLFIWGPSASGKTHLLEGLVSRFRTQRRAAAVCLTAERFTIEFLEALHGGGLPSFRHKHRGLQLLAIDDAQFFSGKKHTIAELFHTIDTAVRAGKQLIIAADRPPAELAGIGPELASRLQGGIICPIEPPTQEVRLGILAELAQRFSVEIPHDVQQLLASQASTHARQLQGAVKLLKVASQAQGRPITREMAEEWLGDTLRPARGVRLQDIEHAVCEVFGIDVSTLQSSRRHKDVSQPRMLAMWLARKHTRAALSEIGQFFGNRSHSTVVSAQRRIEHSVAHGETFRLAERSFSAEEAIRLVESRLRRA